MERYFLIHETEDTVTILDQIYANSIEEAAKHFDSKGQVIGEVISEMDLNRRLDFYLYHSHSREGAVDWEDDWEEMSAINI